MKMLENIYYVINEIIVSKKIKVEEPYRNRVTLYYY